MPSRLPHSRLLAGGSLRLFFPRRAALELLGLERPAGFFYRSPAGVFLPSDGECVAAGTGARRPRAGTGNGCTAPDVRSQGAKQPGSGKPVVGERKSDCPFHVLRSGRTGRVSQSPLRKDKGRGKHGDVAAQRKQRPIRGTGIGAGRTAAQHHAATRAAMLRRIRDVGRPDHHRPASPPGGGVR